MGVVALSDMVNLITGTDGVGICSKRLIQTKLSLNKY